MVQARDDRGCESEWYQREGGEIQESLDMETDRWIECGCWGREALRPLLSCWLEQLDRR